MPFRLTGFWRHSEFRNLWAGQTVSVFGSQIRSLALPLTAVLVLDATPADGTANRGRRVSNAPERILGDALGETIGLRVTVVVAVASELIALPGLLFSPVRSLQEIEAVSRNMWAMRPAVFRYKFGAPTQ